MLRLFVFAALLSGAVASCGIKGPLTPPGDTSSVVSAP
jgi:predicted small lipoprotein YifL